MDVKTFSTLSVLVSGLIEDPNKYERVIAISIRPEDPQEIQDLADTFAEAFDFVFKDIKRPVYMDKNASRQVINQIINHLSNLDTPNAQWAKVCLINTLDVMDRFPPKY